MGDAYYDPRCWQCPKCQDAGRAFCEQPWHLFQWRLAADQPAEAGEAEGVMEGKGSVLIIESAYMPRGKEMLATFPSLRPMFVIGPDTPDDEVGRLVNRLRDEGYEVEVDRPLPSKARGRG